MTIERIIAWMKGLEPIGVIHTVGNDCYWHDTTGVINTFNRVKKDDIVISPNPKQGCAHVYRVTYSPKVEETALGPFIAHVKLIDVVQEPALEQYISDLTKYPYL